MLRKRPYVDQSWCVDVVAAPLRREVQDDGRLRFRGRVRGPRDASWRMLRVVTLSDGETIHNAFSIVDRGYQED